MKNIINLGKYLITNNKKIDNKIDVEVSQFKSNRAITLIVLVITIIILLILAGVII